MPVASLVWAQFLAQQHRGTEGFGVWESFNSRIYRTPKQRKMRSYLKNKASYADTILLHHRFPTSTANTATAAHPFNTEDYYDGVKYVFVHNGVVNNPSELRTLHQAAAPAITYRSVQDDGRYNDSEALMWDVVRTIRGEQEGMQARGSIAFICLELDTTGTEDKLTHIYWGRNTGSPLRITSDGALLFLSSENGEDMVLTNRLYDYDVSTGTISDQYMEIPTTSYAALPYTSHTVTNDPDECSTYPYNQAFMWDDADDEPAGTTTDLAISDDDSELYSFLSTLTIDDSDDIVAYNLYDDYLETASDVAEAQRQIIADYDWIEYLKVSPELSAKQEYVLRLLRTAAEFADYDMLPNKKGGLANA